MSFGLKNACRSFARVAARVNPRPQESQRLFGANNFRLVRRSGLGSRGRFRVSFRNFKG